MKCLFLLPLLFFLNIAEAQRQSDPNSADNQETDEETTDQVRPDKKWKASLPGGEYLVSLKAITSINKHSYVLDGTLLVNEVNIDTTGRSLVRFYYIEPITSQTNFDPLKRLENRAKELRNQGRARTGLTIDEMAQKQYPTTTHSHTVEFRVLSERRLATLYRSIQKAWEDDQGREVQTKPEEEE